MLRDTPLSISVTAQLTGYSDAPQFRRAFKNWSGELSPDEYRARVRYVALQAGPAPARFTNWRYLEYIRGPAPKDGLELVRYVERVYSFVDRDLTRPLYRTWAHRVLTGPAISDLDSAFTPPCRGPGTDLPVPFLDPTRGMLFAYEECGDLSEWAHSDKPPRPPPGARRVAPPARQGFYQLRIYACFPFPWAFIRRCPLRITRSGPLQAQPRLCAPIRPRF